MAKYLGAIPSTYRKEKAVHYDLQKKGSITETIVANIPDNKYMTNIEYRNSLKLKPVENLAIDVIRSHFPTVTTKLSGKMKAEPTV